MKTLLVLFAVLLASTTGAMATQDAGQPIVPSIEAREAAPVDESGNVVTHGSFVPKQIFVPPAEMQDAAVAPDTTVSEGDAVTEEEAAARAEAEKAAAESAERANRKTILTFIERSSNHTILAKALKELPLAETLDDKAATYTFFAPTDAAFKRLAPAYLKRITDPKKGIEELQRILRYHMTAKSMTIADFSDRLRLERGKVVLEMSQGTPIIITQTGRGEWRLSDQRNSRTNIVARDQKQDNGIVHSIDTVLMPTK